MKITNKTEKRLATLDDLFEACKDLLANYELNLSDQKVYELSPCLFADLCDIKRIILAIEAGADR